MGGQELTHRQWVLLQQALLLVVDKIDEGEMPWDASDGDPPTVAEIDALSVIVGSLPHVNDKAKK